MSAAEVLDNAKPVSAHTWERADDDWYVEPEDCAWALAQVEQLVGKIRDPSCGQGNTVQGLLGAGLKGVYGTDLVDRRDALPTWLFFGTTDFLQDEQLEEDNFVGNPPFGFKGALAEAFCRRALQLARHKVCMYLPLDFLAADGRWQEGGLFADHPFSRAWILTPRPSCPPGRVLRAGGKAEKGRKNFIWIVWDKDDPNPLGTIGVASRVRR